MGPKYSSAPRPLRVVLDNIVEADHIFHNRLVGGDATLRIKRYQSREMMKEEKLLRNLRQRRAAARRSPSSSQQESSRVRRSTYPISTLRKKGRSPLTKTNPSHASTTIANRFLAEIEATSSMSHKTYFRQTIGMCVIVCA